MPSRPRENPAPALVDPPIPRRDRQAGQTPWRRGQDPIQRARLRVGWGAGVVERGGLENRCARKRTVGSNPTPTAIGEDFFGNLLKIPTPHIVLVRRRQPREAESAHRIDLALPLPYPPLGTICIVAGSGGQASSFRRKTALRQSNPDRRTGTPEFGIPSLRSRPAYRPIWATAMTRSRQDRSFPRPRQLPSVAPRGRTASVRPRARCAASSPQLRRRPVTRRAVSTPIGAIR